MNKIQKIILAIFVPIIVLFFAFIIANNIGYKEIKNNANEERILDDVLEETPKTDYHERGNPFDWERT